MKYCQWLCGIALIGLLAGCGGNVSPEGEGFDYPQVTEGNRTTDPATLGSAGGRITIEANMIRRGDTYLTAGAALPSFSVLTASNRFLVKEQPFTVNNKVESPGGYYSGDYSGTFTVPANTGPRDQAYRVVVMVPRVQGSSYRQELSSLVVPAPTAQ